MQSNNLVISPPKTAVSLTTTWENINDVDFLEYVRVKYHLKTY